MVRWCFPVNPTGNPPPQHHQAKDTARFLVRYFQRELDVLVLTPDLGSCSPNHRLKPQHQIPPLHYQTRNRPFFSFGGGNMAAGPSSLSDPWRPNHSTRCTPKRHTARHMSRPSSLSFTPTNNGVEGSRHAHFPLALTLILAPFGALERHSASKIGAGVAPAIKTCRNKCC